MLAHHNRLNQFLTSLIRLFLVALFVAGCTPGAGEPPITLPVSPVETEVPALPQAKSSSSYSCRSR